MLPEPFGPADAPLTYARCLGCSSLFSPSRLADPPQGAAWSAVPRPSPTSRGAWTAARALRGSGRVALAGRADVRLMTKLAAKGLVVSACDPDWGVVEPLVRAGRAVHTGTPSMGGLTPGQDYVWIEGLLEYVRDPVAELRAVREALRPDGRVRIEVPFADGLAFQQYGPDFFLFRAPAVATLFTFDGLARLCARAGFVHVTRAEAPARALGWHFRSQPYGRRWLRGLERFLDGFYRDRSVLALVARVD